MTISKSGTIWHWKKSGLIYDNYDELYEVYINTMQCEHCQTEFTKNNRRCLDHDHESGLFRKIVCHKCNVWDSYIKYPAGYSRKEYQQEYRQKNKDKLSEYQQEYYHANKEQRQEQNKEYYQINKQKISERDRQKIECDCGCIVRRRDIAKHKRTAKHIEYLKLI